MGGVTRGLGISSEVTMPLCVLCERDVVYSSFLREYQRAFANFCRPCRSSCVNMKACMRDGEEHVWVLQRQRSEVKVRRDSLGSSSSLQKAASGQELPLLTK